MMSGVVSREKVAVRVSVVVIALAGVTLLGLLDYLTGRDLMISAFYLIPIAWSTWMVGRSAGLFVSLYSALSWLAGDLLTAFAYSQAALPYWNALMLLALFLPTVYLLSAFQKAHHHLEKTVEERTAALRFEIEERKRMESAKIQAERLATVGMMAAQVAHEVRNPLGAITLNLDLIEGEIRAMTPARGISLAEGIALVGEMREEVRRIDHVISDYLTLARPRVSKKERFSLDDIIRRKIDFMREVFAKAEVKLDLQLSDGNLIEADGDQLWQAILNLIRNALEAMPEGGRLTIRSKREKGGVLALQLRDTGAGMSDFQLSRLFVPFATTKANGTGLGLPLVHQIVTEHDGRIECASALGEGTTFTIFLPTLEKFRNTAEVEHLTETLAYT